MEVSTLFVVGLSSGDINGTETTNTAKLAREDAPLNYEVSSFLCSNIHIICKRDLSETNGFALL
jgi:hypothetical protein